MRDDKLEIMVEKLKRLSDDLDRMQDPDFLRNLNPPTFVDNWFVSPYATFQLVGDVSGHPTLKDGPFESSQLYYFNEDMKLARTLSRWFRLGKPLPDVRRGK